MEMAFAMVVKNSQSCCKQHKCIKAMQKGTARYYANFIEVYNDIVQTGGSKQDIANVFHITTNQVTELATHIRKMVNDSENNFYETSYWTYHKPGLDLLPQFPRRAQNYQAIQCDTIYSPPIDLVYSCLSEEWE